MTINCGVTEAFSKTYYPITTDLKEQLFLPALSTTSYYDFLASLMITLFVIAIIVVFVYEYEALRRSKT